MYRTFAKYLLKFLCSSFLLSTLMKFSQSFFSDSRRKSQVVIQMTTKALTALKAMCPSSAIPTTYHLDPNWGRVLWRFWRRWPCRTPPISSITNASKRWEILSWSSQSPCSTSHRAELCTRASWVVCGVVRCVCVCVCLFHLHSLLFCSKDCPSYHLFS